MDNNVLEAKIILIGNKSVGKTCIAHQLAHGEFLPVSSTTIGAAFFSKQVLYKDHKITLTCWDTAGEEKMRSITTMYFKRARLAVIVYDITDPDSCDDVGGWAQDVSRHCDPDTIIVVVANKIDMLDASTKARVISQSIQHVTSVLEYEGFQGTKVIPVSAKLGDGCDDLFSHILDELLHQRNAGLGFIRPEDDPNRNVVALDSNQPPQKKGCC